MIKKNIIGVLILLFFILDANAQQIQTKVKRVNTFSYGRRAATTIKDKFQNLFRNIPNMVSNPDSISFTGYKYIATIQNKEDAIKYLSKNWYPNAPLVSFFVVRNGKDSILSINIGLSRMKKFDKTKAETYFNKWSADIHRNDKVYQINFVLDGEKLHHFVFVNPETNEIVKTKGLFFGAVPQVAK